jgi:hypothetical protein
MLCFPYLLEQLGLLIVMFVFTDRYFSFDLVKEYWNFGMLRTSCLMMCSHFFIFRSDFTIQLLEIATTYQLHLHLHLPGCITYYPCSNDFKIVESFDC